MGQFIDKRDGHAYKTVEIGGWEWLAENFAFKHPDAEFCWNDSETESRHGLLYSWEAAMESCPEGWRIPLEEDWHILTASAGGEETAGWRLRAASTEWSEAFDDVSYQDWVACEGPQMHGEGGMGSDIYGFNALPSGYKTCNNGEYYPRGELAAWWSATKYITWVSHFYVWRFGRAPDLANCSRRVVKTSVRLVKDQPA
jgi:uncharacterized protein (TIGR02145 family)